MYYVNLGRLMDNHRTMYRVVLAWHLVNNYRKLYYVQGVWRINTEQSMFFMTVQVQDSTGPLSGVWHGLITEPHVLFP